MKKVELFLEKYNNSALRDKIKNVSGFLDEIVQKYIKVLCRRFPVDKGCIDNLLLIKDFSVEPIGIGELGHAGMLIDDLDVKKFKLHYELKLLPNIDTAFLKNEIPSNLTESKVDNYKREAARNIVVFLHELTHAMSYLEFLKYDEEKKDYVALTKEDVAKEDYIYYKAYGGLITNRNEVHGKKVIQALNISKDWLYEAMTEFIAHNVLLDKEFQDLQYFHLSTGEIKPYNIPWSYGPFVNIIFALNSLYNNAFSVAYFTGDTKGAGFDKDCLNVDIVDISVPLNEIIHYFNDDKREEINLKECVHELVNGIKKFLKFIEKTLERENVKANLNDFRIKSLNNEIQNICRCNDYVNFVLEKCKINEKNFKELKQIFETKFKNLEPITIEKSNLNI